MAKMIVVGLDIGTSAIRLVVGETFQEDKPPQILAQVKKESRGLRRGYIVNFEETLNNLKSALREAERQAKTRIKSAVLGIGGITLEAKNGEGQVAVSRADLEITENEIQRVIEASESNLTNFQNRSIIHTIPLSFKLDGQPVPGQPLGMTGNKLEVKTLFIHCLTQHLNDLVRVTNQVGLIVEDVVASPLAASIPTLTVTQKMAGCVLVNIGSQTTSLVVFENDVPISLQILPLGSNDVTNDIAIGLRIPLEEAEAIKLSGNETSTLRKKLDEIIEARLSDIFELIESHLKKIGRSGLLPAGAVIVGGGSNIPNLEKLAKHALRLPVKVFDPATVPRLKNQLRDAGWAVAYGLCLFGLGEVSEEPFGPNKIIRTTTNLFWRWLRGFWP